MDAILDTLVDLLREQFGVRPADLHPSALFRQDLGLNGSEAAEFFIQIHRIFGTDLSALHANWLEFFDPDGPTVRGYLIILASLFIVFASEGLLFCLTRPLPGMVIGVAVAAGLSGVFVARRTIPETPKRPLTAAGLAEIIRKGSWPADQGMVR